MENFTRAGKAEQFITDNSPEPEPSGVRQHSVGLLVWCPVCCEKHVPCMQKASWESQMPQGQHCQRYFRFITCLILNALLVVPHSKVSCCYQIFCDSPDTWLPDPTEGLWWLILVVNSTQQRRRELTWEIVSIILACVHALGIVLIAVWRKRARHSVGSAIPGR